jgi:mono/diheme cytochrome c family protein
MKMKSLIVLFSAVAMAAVACHKKAVPTVADRTVQPPPPSSTSPAPPAATTAITYEAGDITVGKTVYETKCGRCHGLKNTADYTVERWPGIMRSMAPKAKLNEIETKQVTAYVMTNAKKS